MSITTTFNQMGTSGARGRIPLGYVTRGLVFMLDALSEPLGTVDGMTDLVSGRRVVLDGTGEVSSSGLLTAARIMCPIWFPGQPVGNTCEVRGYLSGSREFYWRDTPDFSVRIGTSSIAMLYLDPGNTGGISTNRFNSYAFCYTGGLNLVLNGEVWENSETTRGMKIDTTVLLNPELARIRLQTLRLYNRPLSLAEIRSNVATDEKRYR